MKRLHPAFRVRPERQKFVWGRSVRRVLILALCLGAFASVASAQTYSVAWDRNTDPFTVGYRVFGGTSPGVYTWSIDAGNATSTPLNVPVGASYYFVVRAYNAAGDMGPASNEAALELLPPGSPTNVRASSVGSQVTVSWAPPTQGPAATQYLVFAGTSPGASDLLSGYNVGGELSASGALGPGRYYARVQGVNGVGVGPVSPEISFVVGGPDQPGSPSGLSATWQGTVATFRWNPGTGASHYVLEAGSAPGANNLGTFNMGAATQYSVDVPPGTYYVRVRSANAVGVSGPSNEITVRGAGAPSQPTALSATNTASTVTLRWTAPSGAAPTGYILEAGSAPGLANLAVVQLGAQTTYVAAAPPPGTYYVRVRAVNARGTSAPSNEITVRR
jgi:hypothetical protein